MISNINFKIKIKMINEYISYYHFNDFVDKREFS